MNRVNRLFQRLRRDHRCGLVAYVTCGDPDLDTTIRIVRELEAAGADAVELGIPFSDPIADGPVIQAASQRALSGGTNIEGVLRVAAAIRSQSSIPLIAFSYLNPLMRFGIERFAAAASEAGIDSVLCTDLPLESANQTRAALEARGLGMIFLLSPTSSAKRIAAIDRASDGFVYYVSTTGVTGTRKDLDPALLGRLDQIRTTLRKPIAVGFGVSTGEHYRLLADHCDAVVVGSAIVRAIGEGDANGAPARAGAVVREILSGAGVGARSARLTPPSPADTRPA
jgi:tryptophan synthase alpha chain